MAQGGGDVGEAAASAEAWEAGKGVGSPARWQAPWTVVGPRRGGRAVAGRPMWPASRARLMQAWTLSVPVGGWVMPMGQKIIALRAWA